LRKHIAKLEAREAECKDALPKWVQGPGIFGAILHMKERIAALEAENARLRKVVEAATALGDAFDGVRVTAERSVDSKPIGPVVKKFNDALRDFDKHQESTE